MDNMKEFIKNLERDYGSGVEISRLLGIDELERRIDELEKRVLEK